MESRRDKSPKQKQLKWGFAWRVGIRQLLAQNVLNYPESLETAGILRSACCFYHIRDNDYMMAKS